MITVIITVHAPLLKHLQRCLDSVLWQLTPNDNVIVVSDRCDVQEMVMQMHAASHAVSIVTLKQPREVIGGAAASRNLGLGHAQGEWIKFLDADDLLAPFAMNAFRRIAAKLPPEIAMVAGAQIKVHNGIVQGYQDPVDVEAVVTHANPTLPSMTFVRRKAALEVCGFDERIDFEEDWEFWLRLRAAGHRFAIYRRPFCCYCVDDEERAASELTRTHKVEGVDVRAYLAKKYDITPQ